MNNDIANVKEGIAKFKGGITKVEKYTNQDNVLIPGIEKQKYYYCSGRYAGSNGLYIKFCDDYSRRLDITYSLYDADEKLIELDNKRFRMPNHITIDVYEGVIALLGEEHMPPNIYDEFLSLEGKKIDLFIGFDKATLQVNNECATVDAYIPIPEIDAFSSSYMEDRGDYGFGWFCRQNLNLGYII